jgi:hypothetical protein
MCSASAPTAGKFPPGSVLLTRRFKQAAVAAAAFAATVIIGFIVLPRDSSR